MFLMAMAGEQKSSCMQLFGWVSLLCAARPLAHGGHLMSSQVLCHSLVFLAAG